MNPRETGTFQDRAAKLFNSLPENIRNSCIYKKFLNLSKDFLKNKIDTQILIRYKEISYTKK